ncbi:MAG: hypothetical protein M3323_00085 [Actinomycetota bacterium]|nr:hypothetical protein [Actinomycetota bacterium]
MAAERVRVLAAVVVLLLGSAALGLLIGRSPARPARRADPECESWQRAFRWAVPPEKWELLPDATRESTARGGYWVALPTPLFETQATFYRFMAKRPFGCPMPYGPGSQRMGE